MKAALAAAAVAALVACGVKAPPRPQLKPGSTATPAEAPTPPAPGTPPSAPADRP